MQRLAERYGITDVALAQTCKKMGIPTECPSRVLLAPRGFLLILVTER